MATTGRREWLKLTQGGEETPASTCQKTTLYFRFSLVAFMRQQMQRAERRGRTELGHDECSIEPLNNNYRKQNENAWVGVGRRESEGKERRKMKCGDKSERGK